VKRNPPTLRGPAELFARERLVVVLKAPKQLSLAAISWVLGALLRGRARGQRWDAKSTRVVGIWNDTHDVHLW
jgi:hypothetical protein